jgi:hypothetical protein
VVEGFVGHDRIWVVLAVILAKETLLDRKESSTLTASRAVGLHGGSDRTVTISTMISSASHRWSDRLFSLRFFGLTPGVTINLCVFLFLVLEPESAEQRLFAPVLV